MKKSKSWNKIFLLILLLSLLITKNSQSQTGKDSLTVNDIVNLVLQNQPLLSEAMAQVNAVEAKIKSQKSSFYPNMEANLSYEWIGPVISLDFPGLGAFDFNTPNNYNMNVNASYLLYDFGKRGTALDLIKSYKVSAEEKLNLIKSDLSYQSIQIFYSILFLNRSIITKNEQINTLNQHLDITKKKVESGSSTDFDILTTQVRLTNAQNEKIDLENALTKQMILLKNLLGFSPDQNLNLKGDFAVNQSKINGDSIATAALNNRSEIKIARYAENSAKITRQLSNLGNRPTLSLAGSYGIKNGFFPNLDVLRGNWYAGISANIPIFNGFKTEAGIEEAEANEKASSQNILELERKIKVEVQGAAADLNASMDKLKTTEIQIKQAVEAVNRAQVQYGSGVITNLDILDADTSLAQAKLMYLQALYKSVVSFYNLKKAAGDDKYLNM